MKVVVIGSASRDRIIIKKRGENYSQLGGGVYYSSMALASLGVETIAVPLLSKDDHGILKALEHNKIKIIPQWTKETTSYQNLYPEENLDICEGQLLSSVENFELTDELLDKIQNSDAIHLAPLSSNEFSLSLTGNLRRSYSGKISLDGQGYTRGSLPNMRSILKGNIDIIKLDDSEIKHITSDDDELKAVEKLIEFGTSEILVTKASRGSTLYFNGNSYDISAIAPKKMVDPTGCGDAYIAGYLAKRLSGEDPVTSANFGSLIGAKNLEYKGALL